MKSLIKAILRKLGLLQWLRRLQYKNQYRDLNRTLRGQSTYQISYDGMDVRFSLSDPFSTSFFAYHVKDSLYEAEGLKIMMDEIKGDGVLADVGANIGYFSCLVAKHAKQSKVFAFELGDANIRILNENKALNDLSNMEIVHCAVSDSSGIVYHQDSAVGNAVLKIIEDNKGKDPDIVPVKSISLDEFFGPLNIVPSLVKIDVEGAEMKVLKGMEVLIEKSPKILIEIHPSDLIKFNSSEQEVHHFLKSKGYTVQVIENGEKKNRLFYCEK